MQYTTNNLSEEADNIFAYHGNIFQKYQLEYFEAAHYSLKKYEVDHGYVVKKKLGTPPHLLKSLQSLSSACQPKF